MNNSVYSYVGYGIAFVFALYLLGLLFGGDFVFTILIGILVGLLAYSLKNYNFDKDQWKDYD